MPTTAKEAYTDIVRTLTPTERLRLAALILDDLARSEVAVRDNRDEWSEQDRIEVAHFSLNHAASVCPEDEELV